jgi:hypothetical protein
MSECIYCLETLSDDDTDLHHWRQCDLHPARIENNRLTEELEKYKRLLDLASGVFIHRNAEIKRLTAERDRFKEQHKLCLDKLETLRREL